MQIKGLVNANKRRKNNTYSGDEIKVGEYVFSEHGSIGMTEVHIKYNYKCKKNANSCKKKGIT